VVDGAISLAQVPTSVTELLQDYRTDGDEIVFSSGPIADPLMTAPDLYRYDRDSGAREALFVNPNRDSNLLPVAVFRGRYAFAEINSRLYGENGWALWYMDSRYVKPRLLDQADAHQEIPSPLPIMALSDRWIVWQAFHQTADGERSQLLSVAVPDGPTRILFSARPDTERQYWNPAIDGDRLVYCVVDYSASRTPRYIYQLDLAETPPNPVRLDNSGRAVTPAIQGDLVVWKEADDVFDWGVITLHVLSSGQESRVTLGTQQELNYPSVGDRFVAAWGRDYGVLYIYDLAARQPVLIEEQPDAPNAGSVRPLVDGNLLLWTSFTDPQGGLQLKWAALPPP